MLSPPNTVESLRELQRFSVDQLEDLGSDGCSKVLEVCKEGCTAISDVFLAGLLPTLLADKPITFMEGVAEDWGEKGFLMHTEGRPTGKLLV